MIRKNLWRAFWVLVIVGCAWILFVGRPMLNQSIATDKAAHTFVAGVEKLELKAFSSGCWDFPDPMPYYQVTFDRTVEIKIRNSETITLTKAVFVSLADVHYNNPSSTWMVDLVALMGHDVQDWHYEATEFCLKSGIKTPFLVHLNIMR